MELHSSINCCFRELTSKDPRSELGYRLTVMVDTHDPARPLSVVHVPALGNKVGVSSEVWITTSVCKTD